MITCPFCNKLVEIAENKSHNHLYDDEPDDFSCPTMVQTGPDIIESHYIRRTLQGSLPEHMAIVMPFSVIWTTGTNKIEVTHWTRAPTNGRVFYQRAGDYEQFVKTTLKFNNLKAFA